MSLFDRSFLIVVGAIVMLAITLNISAWSEREQALRMECIKQGNYSIIRPSGFDCVFREAAK
jgi:hypothetical protein